MNFEYRIIEKKRKNYVFYEIHEVYYNNNDIVFYSKDAITPYGNTIEELYEDLILMLQAYNKPPLQETELLKLLQQNNKKKSV